MTMKMIRHTLLAALAVPLISFGSAERSAAADVTIDGSGFYNARKKVTFRGNGARQAGRYGNFGPDFYRHNRYGVQWLTNRSFQRSGRLSLEFWGMPFYGATEGVVLMTRQVPRIGPGRTQRNVRRQGAALFLDEVRFPEISVWEFRSRGGWVFRDALSFRRSTVL